jgi:hypothetical protein
LPCGAGKSAEERFSQSERAHEVHPKRLLQFLAFSVGHERKWRRSEVRCVVDERIKSAKIAGHLQRDWMDIRLMPNVADDAVGTRLAGDLLDRLGRAGDEGNARTAVNNEPDEGQPQAGSPARDGHAKVFELKMGWHRSELLC